MHILVPAYVRCSETVIGQPPLAWSSLMPARVPLPTFLAVLLPATHLGVLA